MAIGRKIMAFEPRISGYGSVCSTTCATTTAQSNDLVCHQFIAPIGKNLLNMWAIAQTSHSNPKLSSLTSVPCMRRSAPSWLSSWRSPCSPHSCRPRSACRRPGHRRCCRSAWTRSEGGSEGKRRWQEETWTCWTPEIHSWAEIVQQNPALYRYQAIQ